MICCKVLSRALRPNRRRALALLCAGPILIASQAGADELNRTSATRIVINADEAFRALMADPNSRIPRAVLSRALGIAIFPNVKKAGFLVGASLGHGVVLVRRGRGWSPPAIYNTQALSYGYQAGIQAADVVLVIMTRRGLQKMVDGRFSLGNDSAVAVGPVGAKTNLFKFTEVDVLSYARVQGVFAGLSMQGSAMTTSPSMTQAFYGQDVSSAQLLIGHFRGGIPPSAKNLMSTLARYH